MQRRLAHKQCNEHRKWPKIALLISMWLLSTSGLSSDKREHGNFPQYIVPNQDFMFTGDMIYSEFVTAFNQKMCCYSHVLCADSFWVLRPSYNVKAIKKMPCHVRKCEKTSRDIYIQAAHMQKECNCTAFHFTGRMIEFYF